MANWASPVDINLSETATFKVKPNAALLALTALNLGWRTLEGMRKFHVPANAIIKPSGNKSPEYLTNLLKIMLPIDLGRSSGNIRVPELSSEMGKMIRSVLDTKKNGELAGFSNLFKEYLVPIYYIPPELLVANKTKPAEISAEFTKKNGSKLTPNIGSIQLFLVKLALNIDDTRADWKTWTILEEETANHYLNYVDANLNTLNTKFRAVDKAAKDFQKAQADLEAVKSQLADKGAAFGAMKDRNDPKRAALKKEIALLNAQFVTLTEQVSQCEKAATTAQAEFLENKLKTGETKTILKHNICIGDYGIVVRNNGKKIPKARTEEGDDAEEEEEQHEQEMIDEQAIEDAADTVMGIQSRESYRVGEEGIDENDVRLLPFEYIKRIQVVGATIAKNIDDEKKSGASAVDPTLAKSFAPFAMLHNGQITNKGKQMKKMENALYPHNYTINHFSVSLPKVRSDGGILMLKYNKSKLPFPMFSVRTLMLNHVWLMEQRHLALELSGGKAAGATPKTPSVAKTIPKPASTAGLIDLSGEDEDEKPVEEKKEKKKKAVLTKEEKKAAKKAAKKAEKIAAKKAAKEAEKKTKQQQKQPATVEASSKKSVLDEPLSHEPSSESEEKVKASSGGVKRKLDFDGIPETNKKAKKTEAPVSVPVAPSPSKPKKRKAEKAELSNESRELVKSPQKKATVEATTPLKAVEMVAVDDLKFDETRTLDKALMDLLEYGSWNVEDIVSATDPDFAILKREANSLLSSATSTNFREYFPPPSALPTNDELEEAHQLLSTGPESTIDLGVLLGAMQIGLNAAAAPIYHSNCVISKPALQEQEYEAAAVDYLSSPSGHKDMHLMTTSLVNAIDLINRACRGESRGIGLLSQWKPEQQTSSAAAPIIVL